MSRELIIQDADDAINPATKNPQETDFTDYLNNKLTPKSIYHSVNKIKYNNKFAVKFFDIEHRIIQIMLLCLMMEILDEIHFMKF